MAAVPCEVLNQHGEKLLIEAVETETSSVDYAVVSGQVVPRKSKETDQMGQSIPLQGGHVSLGYRAKNIMYQTHGPVTFELIAGSIWSEVSDSLNSPLQHTSITNLRYVRNKAANLLPTVITPPVTLQHVYLQGCGI